MMCCVQGIDVVMGCVSLKLAPGHVSLVMVANSFNEVHSALFYHKIWLISAFSGFKNSWFQE